MLPVSTGSLFVARVGIRVAVHAGLRSANRQAIEPPEKWGIQRGYWDVWYQADRSETNRPVGLVATFEYVADDLTDAEDQALSIAERLGMLSAFFAGSPVQPSQLIRIARTDAAGNLEAQWDYFYDSELPPSVEFNPVELHAFLTRFADTPLATREQLERASRWYGLSIGGLTIPDTYLAIWIGLESVGTLLSERFHPNGVKAPCERCKNETGTGRNRKFAGIEHLIRTVAPELLDGSSLDDLKKLRDEIAHSLRPLEELSTDASTVVDDLQLCLGTAVLTAHSGPTKEPTYGWQGALPRDNAYQPDARLELIAPVPLPKQRPFQNGWVDTQRVLEDNHPRVNDKGEFEQDGMLHASFKAAAPPGITNDQFSLRYALFARRGVSYYLKTKTVPPFHDIEVGEWREYEVTAAWERVAEPQAES